MIRASRYRESPAVRTIFTAELIRPQPINATCKRLLTAVYPCSELVIISRCGLRHCWNFGKGPQPSLGAHDGMILRHRLLQTVVVGMRTRGGAWGLKLERLGLTLWPPLNGMDDENVGLQQDRGWSIDLQLSSSFMHESPSDTRYGPLRCLYWCV
jgi:hypothetical protein